MPRPTEASISLENIISNLNIVREHVGDTVKIFPVVKADAYGHGAGEVVKALKTQGIENFCVAMVEEAKELIESGVRAQYIILGGIFEAEAEDAVNLDLLPVVFTMEQAESLDQEASRLKRKARVHVKLDTGMGRIGVDSMEIFRFVEAVSKLENISVEGILSHLSVADSDDEENRDYTKEQLEGFDVVKKGLKNKGYNIPFFHTAGSSGLLSWPESHHEAVRPGIILYGSSPRAGFSIPQEFKGALTLRSKISFLKKVPKGTSISYGRKSIVKRESLIATVPVGYADGLPRRLPVGFEFLVRGQRAPLTGVVTMDMIMLDVTDIKGAAEGDEVILIGVSGEDRIRVEHIAEAAGTIPYEIFTSISSRVPRKYTGKI